MERIAGHGYTGREGGREGVRQAGRQAGEGREGKESVRATKYGER